MDIRNAVKGKGTQQVNNPTGKSSQHVTPLQNKKDADAETAAATENLLKDLAEQEVDNEDYGDPEVAQNMAFIRKNGITKDDVFRVLDLIITDGTVMWTFNLFDRIPVQFKMRESWITTLILESVDKTAEENKNMSVSFYNNIISERNLAGSLLKYKDQAFDVTDRESFYETLNTITKFPYVVIAALVDKLAVFDRLVAVATSDWAIKNFTKPQKADF